MEPQLPRVPYFGQEVRILGQKKVLPVPFVLFAYESLIELFFVLDLIVEVEFGAEAR